MKSIQIKDSYDVWLPRDQQWYANQESYLHYAEKNASFVLHRSWLSIHIEWWLHNIGYYITKPFIKNEKIKAYNLRFQHVDLEERFCGQKKEKDSEKTGHWCISPNGWYPYCSVCYHEPKGGETTKYCPNCGIKMKEERK